jgi:hypothetical protein
MMTRWMEARQSMSRNISPSDENLSPAEAHKINQQMALETALDDTEIENLTTSLREEVVRNHFAERLTLAFARREYRPT